MSTDRTWEDRTRRAFGTLEAARFASGLTVEIERLRSALTEIANHPTTQRNPDGVDQAAHSMRMVAREALGLPVDDPHVCSCGGAGCVACDHPTESAGRLDVGAETQADRSGLGTYPKTEPEEGTP